MVTRLPVFPSFHEALDSSYPRCVEEELLFFFSNVRRPFFRSFRLSFSFSGLFRLFLLYLSVERSLPNLVREKDEMPLEQSSAGKRSNSSRCGGSSSAVVSSDARGAGGGGGEREKSRGGEQGDETRSNHQQNTVIPKM